MANRQLTAEVLSRSGFQKVGCWELSSAGELAHFIDLPSKAGVYAFAIDGVVQYVGLASTSVRQRLGFYRKPGASQQTNVRLNEIIRGRIQQGAVVEILIGHPPNHTWNGLKVSGAEGLEAGLISEFDLPWNMRGASKAGTGLEPEITEGAASTDGFYVYENRIVDKAIVHRANCSFCNEGLGLHGSRTTKSSTWHGPYESAAVALQKARICRRTRTEGCSVCSPL